MSNTAIKMQFASGISNAVRIDQALNEAINPLTAALGSEPLDLVVAFVSSHHTASFQQIANRLRRQLNPRAVLAVNGAAVIGSGIELEQEPGLSILASRLPGVELRSFTLDDLGWPDSVDNPQQLRQAITGDSDTLPAGLLFFADPYSTPMIMLLPALNAALPNVPIVGGMCSAAGSPGYSRLLLNDRIMSEGAIGLAISGNVQIDCTVSQGCRPIGQPWLITKAQNNVIHELGGRKVLQVLRDMATEATQEDRLLMHQGLLVGRVINEYQETFDRGDFLIRNIVGADEDAGFIAIADLVRAGQTVQFHVRDAAAAEEDLAHLLAMQAEHGTAAGAILCTCNGRGSRMFDQPSQEAKMIDQALNHTPLAGFFAAGEIGPIGDENFIHGFTASLAVFRPR